MGTDFRTSFALSLLVACTLSVGWCGHAAWGADPTLLRERGLSAE